MWSYQNEHNMVLSILLLQTSKTDNNALDIDAIYNLKFPMASHYGKISLLSHNICPFTVLFVRNSLN
jgi:hypothetical protein